MNSDAILPGCRVWVEFMSVGNRCRRYETVARRTRTQIVLADSFESRYYRDTLKEIGRGPGSVGAIIGIATDEEIAAFEIEAAARKAREAELAAEERALRRLLACYPAELTRKGDRYELRMRPLTAAQVRAMFAAQKGVKELRG